MLDYLIWIQVSWCLALRDNERGVIGGFAKKGDHFQKGPLWIFCTPCNKEGTQGKRWRDQLKRLIQLSNHVPWGWMVSEES